MVELQESSHPSLGWYLAQSGAPVWVYPGGEGWSNFRNHPTLRSADTSLQSGTPVWIYPGGEGWSNFRNHPTLRSAGTSLQSGGTRLVYRRGDKGRRMVELRESSHPSLGWYLASEWGTRL